MINCKYFRLIDESDGFNDAIDHPSYQPFCNLVSREIFRGRCSCCGSYEPSAEDLSNYDLRYEFRELKMELATAISTNTRASAFLIKQLECLKKEAAKRNVDIV